MTDEISHDAEWAALARYVAGESPADEADAVRLWLAADPARARLVEVLERATTPVTRVDADSIDVEAALARVRSRLDTESEVGVATFSAGAAAASPGRAGTRPASVTGSRRLPSRRGSPWGPDRSVPLWRGAAIRAVAAVLVIAVGAWFWLGTRIALPDGGAMAQTFVTGIGERDSVRLADGTLAILAPGTELRVPAAYGRADRVLELRGEAWFDVVHDTARAFSVRAGEAIVQDLGTAFSVRSDSAEVRVVVTEGSVVLRGSAMDATSGVVLHAGDVGVMPGDSAPTAHQGAATEEDLAWRSGRLVFRDAPMLRVREELRRWYGVELRVEDAALAQRHLTATFEGEPVERVLAVIALALGAQVERHGDTAVVRPSGGAGTR